MRDQSLIVQGGGLQNERGEGGFHMMYIMSTLGECGGKRQSSRSRSRPGQHHL